MIWSHMPDTTKASAKPASPVVRPPKNSAKRKIPRDVASMWLLPTQREQRLHGDTHLVGRLQHPRRLRYPTQSCRATCRSSRAPGTGATQAVRQTLILPEPADVATLM